MGNIQVGHLSKRKIVKDLNGNIIDWYDETDGGWIVQRRVVKNIDKWNEHLKKQEDLKEASLAITKQKVDNNAPDRTVNPNKMKEIEDKIESNKKETDAKLDAILALLKKE